MTRIDRIVQNILQDPWTSRIFLAFTVGLFLSCSAEFAAGQATGTRRDAGGTAHMQTVHTAPGIMPMTR